MYLIPGVVVRARAASAGPRPPAPCRMHGPRRETAAAGSAPLFPKRHRSGARGESVFDLAIFSVFKNITKPGVSV